MRSSSRIRLLPTSFESALIAVFFLASSGTLQQYLGIAGALAYLVVLAVLIPVAVRVALPWFLAHTSERSALWLALAHARRAGRRVRRRVPAREQPQWSHRE